MVCFGLCCGGLLVGNGLRNNTEPAEQMRVLSLYSCVSDMGKMGSLSGGGRRGSK